MKFAGTLFALLAVLAAFPSFSYGQGETPDPAQLTADYKKKLEKDFFKAVPWVQTFDAACVQAKKEDKLVLGYFSRSYAPCPPCNLLEGEALVAPWFQEAAKSFIPYLNITTLLPDTPDQDLLEKKGGDGFPYVIFMDSAGAVLTDRIWPQDKEALEKAMGEAKTQLASLNVLREAAAKNANDPVARANLAMKLFLLRAGDKTAAEIAEMAKTPGLDAGVLTQFKTFEIRQRILAADAAARNSATSQEAYMAAVEGAMYQALKDGASLPATDEMSQMLYFAGVEGALKAKDKVIAKKAIEGIEAFLNHIIAQDPSVKDRADAFLGDVKHRLQDLEAGVDHESHKK
jgi:hypothetical protein